MMRSVLIVLLLAGTLQAADPVINVITPGETWTDDTTVVFDVNVACATAYYAFVDWDESLVGYWRFENDLSDSSPYGNDGQCWSNKETAWPYAIDANYVSGNFGQALGFGVGTFSLDDIDWFDVGTPDEFDFERDDSFSISFWILTPGVTTTSGYPFQKGVSGDARWYMRRASGAYWFLVGGRKCETSVIDTSSWTHIAAVYNGTELYTYVNGASDSVWREGTISDTIRTPDTLRFGMGDCAIDEVMVFNRALSSSEIAALYDANVDNLAANISGLSEVVEYSYTVWGVNAAGEDANTIDTVTVDVASSDPTGTITSPISPRRTSDTSMTFTGTAADTNADTTLALATLWWDVGQEPGVLASSGLTDSLSGNSDTWSIAAAGPLSGTITWNVKLKDSADNEGYISDSNNTLIIGQDEYYVATDGSDEAAGTIGAPFATIQHFADNCYPGDTCYIRAGTYRETVTPVRGGTADANIVFTAYNDESVTISGADIVDGGWSVHSGSIYKTSAMTWDMGTGENQMYISGTALLEARWPNSTDLADSQWSLLDGYTRYSSTDYEFTDSDLPDVNWVGAVMRYTIPAYWAFSGIVSSCSTGTVRVDAHADIASEHWDQIEGAAYYIIGALAALDTAGEWFYDTDADVLYLWAPGSVDPATLTVETKARDYALDLSGLSHLRFDGIDVVGAGVLTDMYSTYIDIDDMTMTYGNHHAIMDAAGREGGRAVVLRGSHHTISNSTIDYCSGAGILLDNYSTVDNCTVNHAVYAAGLPGSIDCMPASTYSSILNSTVCNGGGVLIDMTGARRYSVLRNVLHDNDYNQELSDLGSLYMIGTNGDGTVIAYNRIYNNYYAGIYLDSGCSNITILYNVIYTNIVHWRYPTHGPHGILMNGPATGNHIYNNTLGDMRFEVHLGGVYTNSIVRNTVGEWVVPNDGGQLTPEEIFAAYGGLTMTNCMDTRLSLGGSSEDANDVYVDYAGHDYRLKSGSPAINAGMDVGYHTDIRGYHDGGLPDIGAYSYGSFKLFLRKE